MLSSTDSVVDSDADGDNYGGAKNGIISGLEPVSDHVCMSQLYRVYGRKYHSES